MADGISLSANVFRPKKGGRYPVVMFFTAYDKDKGPEAYPPPLNASYLPDFDLGTFQVSPWTMWEAPDPAFWSSDGYAVVQVDSRGSFEGIDNGFDQVKSVRLEVRESLNTYKVRYEDSWPIDGTDYKKLYLYWKSV